MTGRVVVVDDGVTLHVDGPVTTDRAVVLLHSAWGIGPHVHDALNRFASDGYLAVAPDLFHRKNLPPGFDIRGRFFDDRPAFASWLEGADALMSDVQLALSYIGGFGIELPRTALVGYSYGGWAAFLGGTRWKLGACVSWYSNGIGEKSYEENPELPALIERAPLLKSPWLGLFGADDPLFVPGEVANIEAAVSRAGVDTDVREFVDVGHAFDLAAMSPDAEAAVTIATSEARAIEREWLTGHLTHTEEQGR